MVGVIAAAIGAFAVGVFVLWILVYASGLIRPKVSTEPGITGAAAMERKVLLVTGMILFTGVFLTGYSFWDPARKAQAVERQTDQSIHRGAELYATLCYSCHGVDGLGAVVPDTDPPRIAPQLNREQFWNPDPDEFERNYEFVYKTIERGRPGTPMPAWGMDDGGTLNQEQIHELTLLIVRGNRIVRGHEAWDLAQEIVEENIAHGAPTPIPVEVALAANIPPELRAGAEAFTRNGCAACHSVQPGVTLSGPSLAGLADRAAQRVPGQSAVEYIANSIRNPTAYVVEGFQPIMPPFSEAQIPPDQLENLVQYLLSLD